MEEISMNTFEIESYINDHSSVLTDFRAKYLNFLNRKNAACSTDKKGSTLRIEREADKAVNNFIAQITSNISSKLTNIQRKKSPEWIKCIENNQVIDALEESVIDLDFGD